MREKLPKASINLANFKVNLACSKVGNKAKNFTYNY